MEFELFREISKFPFIWDGNLYDSKSLPQNKHCSNCRYLDCLVLRQGITREHLCRLGFNSFNLNLTEGKVILNGLITEDNKEIKAGRKEARKAYQFSRKLILDYIHEVNQISNFIDNGIKRNIQENFTLFHDVRTSYAIAFSNLEAIILESPGYSFMEKLQNCNQKIIDLYDSLELVTSQINLIDVMVNPGAILQGAKTDINLFRLTHKLVKLFQVKAAKRNLTIQYSSDQTIPFGSYHESIKLIPIIFIENAIKYSEPNTRILIAIEFLNNKIKYSISTYGLEVPEEEANLIFQKQKRGSNAKRYTSEGIGMGLYIAKRIVEEHGGRIYYLFDKKHSNYGFNIFTIEV